MNTYLIPRGICHRVLKMLRSLYYSLTEYLIGNFISLKKKFNFGKFDSEFQKEFYSFSIIYRRAYRKCHITLYTEKICN